MAGSWIDECMWPLPVWDESTTQIYTQKFRASARGLPCIQDDQAYGSSNVPWLMYMTVPPLASIASHQEFPNICIFVFPANAVEVWSLQLNCLQSAQYQNVWNFIDLTLDSVTAKLSEGSQEFLGRCQSSCQHKEVHKNQQIPWWDSFSRYMPGIWYQVLAVVHSVETTPFPRC